jgi:transcriptional regulator with XRE-family HTH domain
MHLSEWLAANGKTDAWLAEQIGRERSVVTKIRNGKSMPSFGTAQAIMDVTGGAVTPNDFLPAREQPLQAAQ